MKLAEILSLSEAAKTTEDALDKEFGLFVKQDGADSKCILFSTSRCLDLIDSLKQGTLRSSPDDSDVPDYFEDDRLKKPEQQPNDPSVPPPPWDVVAPNSSTQGEQEKPSGRDATQRNRCEWLEKKFSTRIVVGEITASNVEDDLWRVGSSVATGKYGPMLYEAVMAAVYPGWLRSDGSLTSFSRKVWNVMYSRPDVEKKWVGDYSLYQVEISSPAAGLQSQAAHEFEGDLIGGRWGDDAMTPEVFKTEFLDKIPPEERSQLGPFYAYRLRGNRMKTANYKALIKNGQDALEELAGAFGLSVDQVETTLQWGSAQMFGRRYHSY